MKSNNPSCSTSFIVSPSSQVLRTSTARRANSTCNAHNRHAIIMKKVRKSVSQEEDNVVDVFGGSNMSQEELLASALGKDLSNNTPTTEKKTKKGKKGKGKTIIEDEDNAVDVFGGGNVDSADLLANALSDNNGKASNGTASQTEKKKKKKKGRKGSVIDEDDNAIDVFGNTSISADELLADALGESPASTSTSSQPSKKNKKNAKKGKILENQNNAVDVFADPEVSSEQLLADALSTDEDSSSKSQKEKQQDQLQEIETPLDVVNKEENAIAADAATTNDTIDTQVDEEDESFDDDDDEKLIVEEDFEPELEVVKEFDAVDEEFSNFTIQGRQKNRKKTLDTASTTRVSDPRRATLASAGGGKYVSVRLDDVKMVFRNTPVLEGVSWSVQTGERVGLIGENGAGKTTQLRIIAGLLTPTSGEVVRSSQKVQASFLRQEFIDELDPRRTLREEFFSAFEEENKLLADYKQAEKDIELAGEDLEKLEVCLNRMEELRELCEDKNAWNLDSRIDKIMPGLGFNEDDNDKLVASFSGGWKVRIGLGKVLLQDPDILLLDEPSNHLDNESVEWLEGYLRTCKLPMVVVSHDREFLDRVCTKIVDMEGGEAFEYPGNYSTFVKLKAEQKKAWQTAYDRQQKFIKEQESYIKRNRRSPARSSQVKSRQKMLDRMARTGQLVKEPPRQGKPLVFRFPPAPRAGRDCVIIDDMTHGYNGKVLFDDVSLTIERGDRIALIGPNGCGKSTLLKMIVALEKQMKGTVECKELTNVSVAYYEQNQADALDLDKTVLDTLKEAAPNDYRYEQIRALLGKFLFRGDDVEKKVKALSGGEKARLALAKIMLEPANVLVFDEPGNHLSISAKEMLEEALQHFDGTLLLVSHDRYLISQVATQIVAIEDKDLVLYDGDYKSYMEKNKELQQRLEKRFIPGVAEIKSAPKVVLEERVDVVDKKQKRKRNFGGSGVQSGKTKEMNAKRWN